MNNLLVEIIKGIEYIINYSDKLYWLSSRDQPK